MFLDCDMNCLLIEAMNDVCRPSFVIIAKMLVLQSVGGIEVTCAVVDIMRASKMLSDDNEGNAIRQAM